LSEMKGLRGVRAGEGGVKHLLNKSRIAWLDQVASVACAGRAARLSCFRVVQKVALAPFGEAFVGVMK